MTCHPYSKQFHVNLMLVYYRRRINRSLNHFTYNRFRQTRLTEFPLRVCALFPSHLDLCHILCSPVSFLFLSFSSKGPCCFVLEYPQYLLFPQSGSTKFRSQKWMLGVQGYVALFLIFVKAIPTCHVTNELFLKHTECRRGDVPCFVHDLSCQNTRRPRL